MALLAPRLCGCGRKVPGGQPCPHCEAKRRKHAEARRANAPHRQLYRTVEWFKLRSKVLKEQPVCAHPGCCEKATVVDHRVPHKGDERLFFDRNNLVGLCAHHHNTVAQSCERRGAQKPW